ncbi:TRANSLOCATION PROTEIN SEC62 [Salix purpurea]|uniref:Translocation protein SEC62 n=1 Tax=Salix purpurea TaxID=77065 RepID=A0A9Q0PQA6_SALPP|nr:TRANSLOCATION PROTEIN SEC62 [Salix purpurea]
MKKSGGAADKKRVRRSSGAVTNATRDLNSDTPPRQPYKLYENGCMYCLPVHFQSINKLQKKDVFQLFAEKVRDHKDLVSRWAVLQETRVEYFRGKDFVSFLKNHSEVKDILELNNNLEVEEIANTLLSKNLLVRCDRVVKTVRPGKKKLSTWPAHLEIFPDQVFSENDAFFAWAFVKRRPLWQTLLSLSWPVLTLAICMFPSSGSALSTSRSLAGYNLVSSKFSSPKFRVEVRATVFGALYILLGKRVWFFPNILAEEATLGELFRFWPNKDEEERPKWTTRLFYALVAVLIILLLRHHAPDEAARARYQKRMSNIIDEVLEWSPSLALSGMMEKQPTVMNATEPNNFTGSGKTDSEKEPPVDDDDEGGETILEQHRDEEIKNMEDTNQHQNQDHI